MVSNRRGPILAWEINVFSALNLLLSALYNDKWRRVGPFSQRSSGLWQGLDLQEDAGDLILTFLILILIYAFIFGSISLENALNYKGPQLFWHVLSVPIRIGLNWFIIELIIFLVYFYHIWIACLCVFLISQILVRLIIRKISFFDGLAWVLPELETKTLCQINWVIKGLGPLINLVFFNSIVMGTTFLRSR